MPDPLEGAGAEYLIQLLRAAISVPAAAADPASARIAGVLLTTLAGRHEDDHLEPFFAHDGEEPVSYEVRSYDAAGTIVSRTTYAAAGPAIRAAGGSTTGPPPTAEVVVRSESGAETWMLRLQDRSPTYRIPEQGTGAGPVVPTEVDAEQRRLSATAEDVVATLREMLDEMTVHVDATAIEEVVRSAVGPRPEGAAEIAQAVATQIAYLIPNASEIADRVVRALGGTAPGDAQRLPAKTVVAPIYDPLDAAAQDALAAEQSAGRQDPRGPDARPARQGVPPARIAPAPPGENP